MSETNKMIPPPYLPYRTFDGYIEGLRASGIPAKIDRSVLPNKSRLEQTMLLNTLQFLGLITTERISTPALTTLVNAADAEKRQKALREILMTRFSFLFTDGFRLENATPSMLQAAFTEVGVSGDTVRKAMAFFLMAAQEAQIPVSSYLRARPGRPPGSRKRGKGSSTEAGKREPRPSTPSIISATRKSLLNLLMEDIFDPERMDKTEQEAVWTLAKYLKKNEPNG